MNCPASNHERRTFLGLLTIGLAATLAGCSENTEPTAAAAPEPPPPSPNSPVPSTSTSPSTSASPSTSTSPSARSRVLSRGPSGTSHIALTIDDGYCDRCVRGYVDLAARTGIHITFSPNGTYDTVWSKHAATLRPLIEREQVQFINHTFNHWDLRRLTERQIADELERNEDWVSSTFGTSTLPYYRPPYGYRNTYVDGVTAQLGYTRTVLWNGTYGDAAQVTPEYLMSEARKYTRPGTIMLGHANHSTVLGLFDEITQLIRERGLTPVTLDEMFGTSRPT